jgi:hypothetical protein
VLSEQNNTTPPLANQPQPRSLRFAMTLNFVLPGLGQLYLGQRRFGSLLAGGFLACFVAMLAIFLNGYRQYLNIATSDDILESGFLERIGGVFHTGWLMGLLVVSVVIFIVSVASLSSASRCATTGSVTPTKT